MSDSPEQIQTEYQRGFTAGINHMEETTVTFWKNKADDSTARNKCLQEVKDELVAERDRMREVVAQRYDIIEQLRKAYATPEGMVRQINFMNAFAVWDETLADPLEKALTPHESPADAPNEETLKAIAEDLDPSIYANVDELIDDVIDDAPCPEMEKKQ